MNGLLKVAYQSLPQRLTSFFFGNISGWEYNGDMGSSDHRTKIAKITHQGRRPLWAPANGDFTRHDSYFFLPNSRGKNHLCSRNWLQVHMSDILSPPRLSIRIFFPFARNTQKMRSSTRATNWADAFSCARSLPLNAHAQKKGNRQSKMRWQELIAIFSRMISAIFSAARENKRPSFCPFSRSQLGNGTLRVMANKCIWRTANFETSTAKLFPLLSGLRLGLGQKLLGAKERFVEG